MMHLLDRQLAVAKRSEREFGLGNTIVEVDAQQRNVIDHGRANGSDEQQYAGCEEAESADVVEELSDTHDDDVVMFVVLGDFVVCVKDKREEERNRE